MPIREFQQRRQGGAVAAFQAPGTSPRALNVSGVRNALSDWAAQVGQEREQQASQRARELGMQAQADQPVGALAQTPDYAWRFQQAFREGAYTLFEEQLKLDASRQVSELSRKHFNDPQGFANSWQGYSDSLISSLKESDPTSVPAVRQALEGYGESGYQRLADQMFARELQAQGVRALQLYEGRRAAFADMLLNDPDEQVYRDMLDELDTLLLTEFEQGLISVETLEAGQRRHRESLATEYYRGQFGRSMQSEDLPGAEAVIESLLRGEGFEDNDRGRALASSLAQELRAALGGESMSQMVALRNRQLEDMLSGVREGARVDMGQAQEFADFVATHGTPLQQYELGKTMTALQVVQRLQGQIENAPLVALGGIRSQVASAFDQLPSEVRSAALSAIDAETTRLQTAMREGTELMADEELSWRVASREGLLGRHARMESRFGYPLDHYWAAPEVRQNAADFEDAMLRGEFGEAQAVLAQSLGVFMDNPAVFINEAVRHGGASGPMYLFGALQLTGAQYNANEVMEAIAVANRAGVGTLLSRNNADDTDITNHGPVMQAVRALSMGDENLRQDLTQTVVALYAGIRDMKPELSRSQARTEIERLLAPYTNVVEFSNGTVLPELYLSGHRLGLRAVRDEVNAYLDDPTKLGFGPDQTARVDRVIPRRRGDGTIGFWSPYPDPQTNRAGFLTDDMGQVISIDPQITEIRLQMERERRERERAEMEWMAPLGLVPERVEWDRLLGFGNWTQVAPLRSAAGMFGLADSTVLEAIQFSGQGMDAQDAGARTRFLLPPDAIESARWSEIEKANRRAIPPGMRDLRYGNIAGLVAVDRWLQAEQAFADDRRAQLAAYWVGVTPLKQLQRDAGDRWYEELPLAAKKFINNVEQRLE